MGKLYKWIAITDRFSKIYLDKKFEALGINTSQHMFIIHICENEGITQDKLLPLVHLNKSNITRGLAKLEENGFIYKEPCVKDKRTARLYSTAKARAIYQEIIAIENQWSNMLTSKLTGAEKTLLLRLMQTAGKTAIEWVSESEEENECGHSGCGGGGEEKDE